MLDKCGSLPASSSQSKRSTNKQHNFKVSGRATNNYPYAASKSEVGLRPDSDQLTLNSDDGNNFNYNGDEDLASGDQQEMPVST